MNCPAQAKEPTGRLLILFVTGTAPRSQRARANLSRMLEQIGSADIQPHEIDLLEAPKEGIKHSVFATPALMSRGRSGEVAVLYGDLSDTEQLQRFLAGMA